MGKNILKDILIESTEMVEKRFLNSYFWTLNNIIASWRTVPKGAEVIIKNEIGWHLTNHAVNDDTSFCPRYQCELTTREDAEKKDQLIVKKIGLLHQILDVQNIQNKKQKKDPRSNNEGEKTLDDLLEAFVGIEYDVFLFVPLGQFLSSAHIDVILGRDTVGNEIPFLCVRNPGLSIDKITEEIIKLSSEWYRRTTGAKTTMLAFIDRLEETHISSS